MNSLRCATTLKAKGIAPIALGSKNRWPAQFWFDYLLLRTAGPDYRAKLMSGESPIPTPKWCAALDTVEGPVRQGLFRRKRQCR